MGMVGMGISMPTTTRVLVRNTRASDTQVKLMFNIKSRTKSALESVIANAVSAKDIQRELQRRALRESADYVIEHMQNTQSVATVHAVHDVATRAISTPGLVLEFGVYTGGTLNYIASLLPDREIYGFDSFEGLPESWRDGFARGTFAIQHLPRVRGNVHLVKGWFEDTLPLFVNSAVANVAYMHIDCDLYSSTATIFQHLAQRIVVGTVIVFDEYFNYPGWQNGEFRAFQEYLAARHRRCEYLTYNHRHEQVAVRITQ